MAGESIFIGYRRDDTADVAGRIYDAMSQRFGKGRVFKDVDNIGPGVDFGDYIKSVLPKCRVALMLIGPNWLESKDEDGRPRLEDEHDWVRVEIQTALATPGVLAVPVLVNGARMPRASEVPESLRPLLRRNAAIIRRDPDFHDDVERLGAALKTSVSTGILDLSKLGTGTVPQAPRQKQQRRGLGGLALVTLGVLLAAAVTALVVWAPWQMNQLVSNPSAGAEQVNDADNGMTVVERVPEAVRQQVHEPAVPPSNNDTAASRPDSNEPEWMAAARAIEGCWRRVREGDYASEQYVEFRIYENGLEKNGERYRARYEPPNGVSIIGGIERVRDIWSVQDGVLTDWPGGVGAAYRRVGCPTE